MWYSENQVLEGLLNGAKTPKEYRKSLFSVYKTMKSYFPVEYREKYRFRYWEDKLKFVCNLENYRIFKIYLKNRNLLIQFCYPNRKFDDLNYEKKIIKEWDFTVAPCKLVYMNIIDAAKLDSKVWKGFSEAIKLLANAQKSRQREENVLIDWD